ncbi:carbon storage regulator CsrA [Wansuia hejianensis]|uniref:Translational regulator CsrA n=1 Tax=Wansuia hejianensis TaxID=2763667 RepID=A0A926IN48_9FIRM|nr:carbon storage regulator CsrA [Wansuia hejianensis]MBC8590323.1 carbon storage regulator CsrA [Wansuia hejianensis]
MLILNRKIGESIVLEGDIEIKVLEIQDGKVKIGIEAPKEVTILRKEIYDDVIEENRKSLEMENTLNVLDILQKMNKNER